MRGICRARRASWTKRDILSLIPFRASLLNSQTLNIEALLHKNARRRKGPELLPNLDLSPTKAVGLPKGVKLMFETVEVG